MKASVFLQAALACSLTCLHEQVSCKPELLQLTVQLTAPARKQETAQPPCTVLQHPVDGSSSLALQAGNRQQACRCSTSSAATACVWLVLCAGRTLLIHVYADEDAIIVVTVAATSAKACLKVLTLLSAGLLGLTECLPATPKLDSKHLVVNTLMAPPKKYCTPRQPM
jgi:hypothetical protein